MSWVDTARAGERGNRQPGRPAAGSESRWRWVARGKRRVCRSRVAHARVRRRQSEWVARKARTSVRKASRAQRSLRDERLPAEGTDRGSVEAFCVATGAASWEMGWVDTARAAGGEIVSRGEGQPLEANRRGVGCRAREKASVAVPVRLERGCGGDNRRGRSGGEESPDFRAGESLRLELQ